MSKNQLLTIWADGITERPWQEYPRPQFVRDSYLNLNGFWDFEITQSKEIPLRFDGKILVPFSPETKLSGVEKSLSPGEFLHYRTVFNITKSFNKGILLLHFGAVDSICKVFVNNIFAGEHIGGYNSFELDITEFAVFGENTLNVVVQDFTDTSFFTNGKQSSKSHGMWYTAQSGIWQTVWIESVPREYIKSCKLTPLFDEGKLRISLEKFGVDNVTAVVLCDGVEVVKCDSAAPVFEITLPKDFKPWSPENPHLYDLHLISRRDFIESYFGMRKFSLVRDANGFLRTHLNNQPYFHNGLLDQGYWPDGLYTAASDDALIFDIEQMKALGFNMLRKHIKVEPLRWYYHCDRLGMLVWQDMPSGGEFQKKLYTLYLPFLGVNKLNDDSRHYRRFSRGNVKSRTLFQTEYKEMIDSLYNAVSIAVWVPFNEAWGQFDAKHWGEWTKQYDPTRLVDHASGWHDQGGGDFLSLHVYFKKVRLPFRKKKRAVALTEFGGYCLKFKEHSFNPEFTYGYAHFKTQGEFENALERLYKRDVISKIKNGLTAAVYTQVSDVEDEVNGLFTYDRKVLKVASERMKKINEKVKLN